MFDGISIFKHMHVFEQCLVIVFLTHKINPKVFCPNFGVHFNLKSALFCFLAEREALEPMLSRNIIKLQITDNHILSKAQSKSKSF